MSKNAKELSFEEALDQLEKLVGSMEDGDIPLTELVEKFEEGSKLLKTCESQLKRAELKIEKLRETDKEPVTDLFEPEADTDN